MIKMNVLKCSCFGGRKLCKFLFRLQAIKWCEPHRLRMSACKVLQFVSALCKLLKLKKKFENYLLVRRHYTYKYIHTYIHTVQWVGFIQCILVLHCPIFVRYTSVLSFII